MFWERSRRRSPFDDEIVDQVAELETSSSVRSRT
jgi:hypothetical protein